MVGNTAQNYTHVLKNSEYILGGGKQILAHCTYGICHRVLTFTWNYLPYMIQAFQLPIFPDFRNNYDLSITVTSPLSIKNIQDPCIIDVYRLILN
jgi:hypothetical protein